MFFFYIFIQLIFPFSSHSFIWILIKSKYSTFVYLIIFLNCVDFFLLLESIQL